MQVKVVSRSENIVLVEWRDQGNVLYRSYLPIEEVADPESGGMTYALNPYEGVPYGAPWHRMADGVCLDGETFEQELYRLGIWTYEQARDNPRIVISAIQSMLGLSVNEVLQAMEVFLTSDVNYDNEEET